MSVAYERAVRAELTKLAAEVCAGVFAAKLDTAKKPYDVPLKTTVIVAVDRLQLDAYLQIEEIVRRVVREEIRAVEEPT